MTVVLGQGRWALDNRAEGDGNNPAIAICRWKTYTAGVASATIAPDRAPTRVKGCCVVLPAALPDVNAGHLARTFKAISDPTRVQMLHMLRASSEPICICDFTAAFDLGQPTISHHVAKLRDAGFVESFKRGVWSFYQLRTDMPAEAREALRLIP
jgi:ArsR family transcriptional regulator, arsenate/arsenite/antimonite-responsive transcriptional repressor